MYRKGDGDDGDGDSDGDGGEGQGVKEIIVEGGRKLLYRALQHLPAALLLF